MDADPADTQPADNERPLCSPAAQQDMDQVLNAGLGFAEQQLQRHGEFYPYAVVKRPDGEIGMVAADLTAAEGIPSSESVIDFCQSALIELRDRDELVAGGIIFDVRLPDSDGVAVHLEHAEGVALVVTVPQEGQGEDLRLGQITGSPTTRKIWPEVAPST